MVEISELSDKAKNKIKWLKIISAILCVLFLITFILLIFLQEHQGKLIFVNFFMGGIAVLFSINLVFLIICLKYIKKGPINEYLKLKNTNLSNLNL